MNRRKLLGAMVAVGAGLPRRADAARSDLRSAARAAWIYSVPLLETARVRANGAEFAPSRSQGSGINAFLHFRDLATSAERLVTAPNVDTLYSMAFVDLANGPATMTLPATGGRYFSLHLMDMYTNSFAVLGTRTTGPDGGSFVILGPSDASPGDAVRAPTPWIWAIARIGVDGPGDMEAVHKIQDGLALKTGPARPLKRFAPRKASWDEVFASAAALLAENPPPVTDREVLRRMAPLGLDRSPSFDAARFTTAEAAEIETGIAEAKTDLATALPEKPIDGWRYSNPDVGVFGQDYILRARVAIGGLGALPRHEAMYIRAIAPDGTVRFRDGTWRLSFAADQIPPVDGFWSLTMYEPGPQGQVFLTDNPLHRYSLGDRTKGLNHNPDGSLDLWMSRQDPGKGRTSNWLPAPQNGPFVVTLRAYLPKPELLNGEYRLPPVTAA